MSDTVVMTTSIITEMGSSITPKSICRCSVKRIHSQWSGCRLWRSPSTRGSEKYCHAVRYANNAATLRMAVFT